jgi:predicted acylesterase/phospholipase RssA
MCQRHCQRWLTVTSGLLLSACAALPRLHAVPEPATEEATIPGIPNARIWRDRDRASLLQLVLLSRKREIAALRQAGRPTDPLPRSCMLAISGGGDSGAFGAGVLSGWTAHGDRPAFKVVTGVSVGALMAPFAFLGSDYDEIVRHVARNAGREDFLEGRSTLAGLLSDGMASTEPMARLLARYVTADLLTAIAAEYAKGRLLFIGTTDLDAGRQVSWNMGAIASSHAPGALELFRKIMVASASIPGVMSPVMIESRRTARPIRKCTWMAAW